MKIKKLRFLIPFIGLGMVLASCGETSLPFDHDPDDTGIDTPWEEFSIPVESLKFASAEKNIVLTMGGEETHTYTYSYEPKNATPTSLIWVSEHPEIASVEAGKVTAHSGGKTKITVSGPLGSTFDPVSLNVEVVVPIKGFSVTETALQFDYGQEKQLTITYDPVDTTQKDLVYTFEDTSLVSESNGVLKANAKAGNTTLKVSSPHLENSDKPVSITVSDEYKYLEAINLNSTSNDIELFKETATVNVASTVPATPSVSLGDIKFATSTPEILSVDEVSGVVTPLKKGVGKVYAYAYEPRTQGHTGDDPDTGHQFNSEEITINVNEEVLTGISLGADSGQTIELDNKVNPTKELSYTLETDNIGHNIPSKFEPIYKVEPANVVSVDQETGLVTAIGKGNATVTILDNYSGKHDMCNFTVTISAETVNVAAGSRTQNKYVDEAVTVTATMSPEPNKLSDPTVVWHYDDTKLTVTENGNKAQVTAKVPGTHGIYASVNGVNSMPVMLDFYKRPGAFVSGTYYVVGQRNFAEDLANDDSWGDSDKAKVMTTIVDRFGPSPLVPPGTADNVDFEAQTTVHVAANEEFKIRSSEWDVPIGGHLVGSAVDYGHVVATSNEESANIKSSIDGIYEVGYKYYNSKGDPEDADPLKRPWKEVYVNSHMLYVSKTTMTIGTSDTDQYVEVHNWNGTLNIVSTDTTKLTYSHDGHGIVTLIPHATGSAKLQFTDDFTTTPVEVSVTIKNVVRKDIYVKANHMYDADNCEIFAHTWKNNTEFEDLHFTAVEGKDSLYTARIDSEYTNILFARFPHGTVNPDFSEGWNKTSDLTIPSGKNMWVFSSWDVPDGSWDSYNPKLTLDKDTVSLYVGGADVTVTASDFTGALTITSKDDTVASVTNSGATYTFHPVAAGTFTFTLKDGKNDEASCTVTVNNTAPTELTIYFAGVNGWSGIKGVFFSFDSGAHYVQASATSGADATHGQYKYVLSAGGNVASLWCYFENNDGTKDQWYHPGNEGWETTNNYVNLSSVGDALQLGQTYVLTYTGNDKHYDNWEHVWFNYTLAAL